jgi:GT2 family glycosyltransferase
MRHTLSIVVINYRTPDLSIACLASLLPELAGIDARVVLVDNDSGDRSVGLLQDWIDEHDTGKRVELVLSPVNSGFSSGNNVGIRAVDSDFVLLLNSDTIVHPGAVATLLQTARDHPQAGLVSPRLEWQDGVAQESCFRQHTPVSELVEAAASGPITRLLRRFVVAQPVSQDVTWPDWTTFACVLVRRPVLDDVGLLDEGFFMYFEDAEYCWRARRKGWRVVNNPAARVVHLRGGTSPLKALSRARKRLPSYFYESRTRYFRLLYGQMGFLAANICWYAGRLVSALRELADRTPRHKADRQWRDIWIGWRTPLRGPQE